MRFRREGEDSGEDREMAKAEELAKGEKKMNNKYTSEQNYNLDTLALLSQLNLHMNLWTALMLTLDRESKLSMKNLPRLLNPLRAKFLQRRCSIARTSGPAGICSRSFLAI